MRRSFLLAALVPLLGGCGLKRVDAGAVAALPLEAKLDLIEAENDLFIAVDAVDEASNRVLETRESARASSDRIGEAKEALKQAKNANDPKHIEIAELAVEESKERRIFLNAWLDVQWALLDVEKAKLDLARARLERTRAQAVKKANVPGAQKIDLEAFERQVASLEARVKQRLEKADERNADAEKVRSGWYATRRVLAGKTGGGQGTPWVE